ncbi:MAG TPA: 4-alpha-glucanotransferase, partial [Saprospiraceae bacterium]|nr:4-alpha-glucanotransferase [Saprospiraceae bacterium]
MTSLANPKIYTRLSTFALQPRRVLHLRQPARPCKNLAQRSLPMLIHLYLRYSTQFGETFSLHLADGRQVGMDCLHDGLWHAALEHDFGTQPLLGYTYQFHDLSGTARWEADLGRHLTADAVQGDTVHVFDYFNPMGAVQNVFETQPFRNIFSPPATAPASSAAQGKKAAAAPCTFRVKAPLLAPGEAVCLLGHGTALRQWDTVAPILLQPRAGWWETQVDLSQESLPLAYKYGRWNTRTNKFLGFEDGDNRALYPPPGGRAEDGLIFQDNFARFPLRAWKGAGVAIPVFSLRSEKSWGVGEFTDLRLLADWAKSAGLRLIQLLPINDTSATRTWADSYPYAAISAFALHPLYINVEQVAGKKHAAILKPYLKQQKALNALPTVDYEEVMRIKWDIMRQLYDLQKSEWQKDPAYQTYFAANRHWLAPYAAFCWLRDTHHTADFSQWSQHATYEAAAIEKLLQPGSHSADQIGLHLFVQWHLHLQLQEATNYAHAQGLAVKGDIPIGIYRHSCDAWVAPELYNMDAQAGA